MVTFILHPEDNYSKIYYKALDLVIEPINSRFNQPGYKVYRNVEDLVLHACRGCPYDTELSSVCDFYKDDISKMQFLKRMTSPKCNCRHNCHSCKLCLLKRRTSQSFQLKHPLLSHCYSYLLLNDLHSVMFGF